MKLEFKDQKMLLANVNARSEVHGDEREPAGDLKFEAFLPNDVLVEFDPALRSLLYCFNDAQQRDLVEEGRKGDPNYLPDLRMPKLMGPFRWDEEMLGATVSLQVRGEKSRVELADAKVNNFQLEVQGGGTVLLSFRVQAHPDERKFGKLCTLIQNEVQVTLTPAEEPPAN
jgi:hypothetical protein